MATPSFVLVQGASRGIGASFVKTILTRTNSNVIATARNPDEAKAFLTPLLTTEQLSRTTFIQLDVQSDSSLEASGLAVKALGKISLLINSAGFLLPEKSLRSVTRENLIKHFEINTIGPVLVAKHMQPSFMHDTKIVNISARTGSIGDNTGLGGWYSYRMSKAALNQATKTIAAEFGRKGMIVASLHPGTVDTALSRDFVKNVPAGQLFSADKSADMMFTVIQGLTGKDNGTFLDYAGEPIVW